MSKYIAYNAHEEAYEEFNTKDEAEKSLEDYFSILQDDPELDKDKILEMSGVYKKVSSLKYVQSSRTWEGHKISYLKAITVNN